MNPGNPYLSFPQPVLPYNVAALDQALHPPGTDPNAIYRSYALTHVGCQGQTQYEDPNASSQNWVTRQAEPIKYDNVVNPVNENSLVPASSYSLWNSTWTQQALANDVTCNTPQQGSASGQVICGTLGTATSVELEKKRSKLLTGGTAVDSVRTCTICNVVCNSQEVFHKHIAGRKHAAQVGLAALGNMAPYFAAVRSQFSSSWNKVPKKVKFVQPAWCDVCKINCNSSDVYVKHLSGKKHQKNLEQLNMVTNNPNAAASTGSSAATVPLIGPPEKPQANKGKSADTPSPWQQAAQSQAAEEDLETKRRKIVEGGAAAGAIRMCTICNVVCNSQTVFSTHIFGQKHADRVKKLAEAGKAATAGQ